MPIGIYRPQMTVEQAEKFFKRKASPDASLSPKEFMKKKFKNKFKKVIDVLTSPIKKEFEMQENQNKIWEQEGKQLNESFSGTMTNRAKKLSKSRPNIKVK